MVKSYKRNDMKLDNIYIVNKWTICYYKCNVSSTENNGGKTNGRAKKL